MVDNSHRTIGSILRGNVEVVGETLAIDADGQRRTWGEIGDAVGRALAYLREIGVRQGQQVSILLPNGVDWAVWAFASSLHGLTIVPANTKLRATELRYQLEQSDTVLLVVPGEDRSEILDTVEEATQADGAAPLLSPGRIVTTESAVRPWLVAYVPPSPVELEDRSAPSDVALIQYTSGTTAFPKGAMITHGALLQNAAGVASRLRLHRGDRYFSASPFFHSGGSTLFLYLGLLARVPIYTTARFQVDRVLDVIESEQVTVYGGIDALWMTLGSSPGFSQERFASVEKGWTAATGDLFDTIVKRTGVPKLVNLYGLSEASPNVTIADVEASYDERRACGRPQSNVEIRIVDPETRSVLPTSSDAGTASGEIEVRGPCVMLGYYKKPDETAEVLQSDGWLRTGDKGRVRSDGALVYEGRYKHMLRVGGENVAAAEIESVLLSHPSVMLAAVIGIPHERLTEVPAAAVVVNDDVTSEELMQYVSSRLAPFKVPRLIRLLEELPTTGSGRVQKFLLGDDFT